MSELSSTPQKNFSSGKLLDHSADLSLQVMLQMVKVFLTQVKSPDMLNKPDQLTFAKCLSLTRSGITKTLFYSVVVLEPANPLSTGHICNL
jgi:hypothetical protein